MHKVNDPLQGDNARLIHYLTRYLRMEDLLEETFTGQLRGQFTLQAKAALRLDFHCWPVK